MLKKKGLVLLTSLTFQVAFMNDAAFATGIGFGPNYLVPNNNYPSYQTGNAIGNGFSVVWQTWYTMLPTNSNDPNGPQTLWWYYAYQVGNLGFQPHIGSYTMLIPDAAASATIYEGDSSIMMPQVRSDGSQRPIDWQTRYWNRYSVDLATDFTQMGWAADQGYSMLPPGNGAPGEGSSAGNPGPAFEFRSTYAPAPVTFKVSDLDYEELVNSSTPPDPFALIVMPGPMNFVPEPGTMVLVVSGLAGLLGFGRKRLIK